MSLIDKTYFIEDINLTGSQLTNLSSWITVYEDDILIKLLGYSLYKALKADLDGSGDPQSQIYKDLVNGAEFSFEFLGQTINTKWEGLRGFNKKSLIAYYVFYQYKNNTEHFNTSAGQKSGLSENSETVSVRPTLIHAWNKVVDMYGVTPYGLSVNDFINNESYYHFNIYPSAYNFLLANLSNYSSWVYEPIEKQNIWGI